MPFKVKIQFFGAFRNFSSDKDIEIHCDAPCSIADIRIALKERLQKCCPLFNESLLKSSVFADENNILPETMMIQQSGCLMILPPISGG